MSIISWDVTEADEHLHDRWLQGFCIQVPDKEIRKQLEQIINTMEQAELPLEDAFSLYEQGLKKLKLCNEKLDLVEKKMQVLGNNGELMEFE